MKYLPTVDAWNPAISAALHSGQLRLQSGQWIQCGDGPKSRFIKATRYGIHAKHYSGPKSTATHKYLEWVRGQREIALHQWANVRAQILIRERAPLFIEVSTEA